MTSEQEKLLDELLEKDSGLTGWEMDFIDDMDQKFRERPLSEKQADALLRVWEKVM